MCIKIIAVVELIHLHNIELNFSSARFDMLIGNGSAVERSGKVKINKCASGLYRTLNF